LHRPVTFFEPGLSARPGRALVALLGVMLLVVACLPGSLIPPTPTPAPELRIGSPPTAAISPTVPVIRRLSAATPGVVRPTVASNVVKVTTAAPNPASNTSPTSAAAPLPTEVGFYPPPSGGPVAPTTQPVEPVNPAPAGTQPAGQAPPPTSTAAPAIPPPAATQPIPTLTPTTTPTAVSAPATPIPSGGYPGGSQQPTIVPEPPGGYPT
jgi:hypothetical protein